MPFSIPPTSHLALRRRLKRQTSCQLPDEKPEESEGTAESPTHRLLYPGPKSPKINACSSLPLESLRKSRESTPRKTKQPSPDCKLPPKSPMVNRFRYPRTLRVPRRSTQDTLTRLAQGSKSSINLGSGKYHIITWVPRVQHQGCGARCHSALLPPPGLTQLTLESYYVRGQLDRTDRVFWAKCWWVKQKTGGFLSCQLFL